MAMADHTEDNDPFEEDIVFDEAGLLGGKMPRSRQQATAGFLPTFMLFIRTVCLCIAFLALGMCVSVSGGPLIKLELGIGESVNLAFQSFTARSVGMLLGAFLGSLLFEVYNRQFLMFVSLVWVAVSVTVLPFTVPTSLWWMYLTIAALGMGLGFLFTGGNVMCLDLWGRQGGASLQALHFSFAVGAFIVPLVIQPFFVGLHPAELHNSSISTFSPSFTTELSRVARDLEQQINSSEAPSNSSSISVDKMYEDVLHQLTSQNVSVSPTDKLDLISTETDVTYTTLNPETTGSVTTENSSTTIRPAKKKPEFTNGSKLPVDDKDVSQKWKKTSNAKSPPVAESETEHVQEITTTSTLPPNTESTSVTESDVTETESIAPQVTTQETPSYDLGILTDEKAVTEIETPSTDKIPSSTSDINKTSSASPTIGTTAIPVTPLDNINKSMVSTPTPRITTTTAKTTTSTTTTTTTPSTVPVLTTAGVAPLILSTSVASVTHITPVPKRVEITTDYVLDHAENNNQEQTFRDPTADVDFIEGPKAENVKESFDVTDEEVISTPPSVHHSSKPGTFSNVTDEGSNYLDNMAQRLKDYGVTKVHLAYICIGIFIIFNALISVVILCHNPRETRSKQDDGNMSKMQKSRIVVFTIIFSVFMFMAEILQGSVHHLLASSATDTGLGIIDKNSKIDGQALFWGLVCLVRFLCILVSGCLRVKPGKLLIAAVLFSLIGAVFLAIGSFGKDDFLWGGIVFLALGLAPILPTSLLWMAQYMRVTHRMCALMIVLASFGNSLAHSLLTHVAGNSHAYAYILVTVSFVSLFFLLVSMCVIYSSQNSKNLGVPVGYHLARQHEEEDSIELTPSGSAVFTPHDTRLSENGEAGQSLLID